MSDLRPMSAPPIAAETRAARQAVDRALLRFAALPPADQAPFARAVTAAHEQLGGTVPEGAELLRRVVNSVSASLEDWQPQAEPRQRPRAAEEAAEEDEDNVETAAPGPAPPVDDRAAADDAASAEADTEPQPVDPLDAFLKGRARDGDVGLITDDPEAVEAARNRLQLLSNGKIGAAGAVILMASGAWPWGVGALGVALWYGQIGNNGVLGDLANLLDRSSVLKGGLISTALRRGDQINPLRPVDTLFHMADMVRGRGRYNSGDASKRDAAVAAGDMATIFAGWHIVMTCAGSAFPPLLGIVGIPLAAGAMVYRGGELFHALHRLAFQVKHRPGVDDPQGMDRVVGVDLDSVAPRDVVLDASETAAEDAFETPAARQLRTLTGAAFALHTAAALVELAADRPDLAQAERQAVMQSLKALADGDVLDGDQLESLTRAATDLAESLQAAGVDVTRPLDESLTADLLGQSRPPRANPEANLPLPDSTKPSQPPKARAARPATTPRLH